ncbi:hypothetical protein ACH5RR_006154 [Cinchona calisaya]|uniref:Uncharacterized protein n=1 Tax=Cinchona calisaya TaxID=153742 RepID=A0ABD3AN62_9GENT
MLHWESFIEGKNLMTIMMQLLPRSATAFTKKCYQKTYAGMINLVPHEENWPELSDVTPTTLLPPLLRRAPGRPKKNRRREAYEGAHSTQIRRSTTFKCSICQSYGHNKRTCQRCPLRAKKGSNTGDQMAIRREKPGKGRASTGLFGAVLWDHGSGNVPVVFSSRGHNPIHNVLGGQTQTNAANVQTNVQIQFQASTSGIKKLAWFTNACQKRGVEVVRPILRKAPSIGAYGSILVVAGCTHPFSRCGTIYEK